MTTALIYTGGTIGSIGSPLAPMTAEAFRARWDTHIAPDLSGAPPAWHWLDPALDSSAMTPADWVALTRALIVALGAADRAVLLHGTDTMAWSAAALAYLTTRIDSEGQPTGRLAAPVVLTGSQRPLFQEDGLAPGGDARDNVLQALAQAERQQAGIRLAFGGLDLQGSRITKVATTDDRAFEMPNGPTEMPALPPVELEELNASLELLAPHLGQRAVLSFAPMPNAPEIQAAILTGAIDQLDGRLGAIVLQGYGIGNLPAAEALAPVLRAARAEGAVIAVTTQVWRGAVDPDSYGAGHWLGELGAIAAGDMTLPALSAKLHLGLAMARLYGWERGEVEAFLLRPIAGEIAISA